MIILEILTASPIHFSSKVGGMNLEPFEIGSEMVIRVSILKSVPGQWLGIPYCKKEDFPAASVGEILSWSLLGV